MGRGECDPRPTRCRKTEKEEIKMKEDEEEEEQERSCVAGDMVPSAARRRRR